MKRIADNIYQITVIFGGVNFYVLDTGNGLAIIDFAMDENSINTLEKELAQAGFTLADVRYALVTHCHYDHIGGLSNLQGRADVTTYVHVGDAPIVRGDTGLNLPDPSTLPNPLDRFMQQSMISNGQHKNQFPAQVDIELTDGDTLDDIMPGLTVVHLPGHTDGQAGYWLPQQKVLFGGDCAMNFFGRMTGPFRGPAPDWNAAIASIQKAADLQPDVLCLGHGPVITQNTTQKLQKLAARLKG
ncbi:MAG: MBL fold metallo-hydrolase [Chloroflexota bacterium]